MAKLKAPLLSLGASGAIGKTLVFMNWKGLDTVREYVIPSNPDTTAQQTQRARVTTMVAAIHTAQALAVNPLVEVDQIAYSALASAKAKIMTWFNQACKLGMDALKLADGYTLYRNGTLNDDDKGDFRPNCGLTDNGVLQVAAGKFFLGTTPTSMITSIAATVVAGDNVHIPGGSGFSGLVAGKKYYWQFRPDAADPCEGSDSGIYFGYAT